MLRKVVEIQNFVVKIQYCIVNLTQNVYFFVRFTIICVKFTNLKLIGYTALLRFLSALSVAPNRKKKQVSTPLRTGTSCDLYKRSGGTIAEPPKNILVIYL